MLCSRLGSTYTHCVLMKHFHGSAKTENCFHKHIALSMLAESLKKKAFRDFEESFCTEYFPYSKLFNRLSLFVPSFVLVTKNERRL